jgi:fatty acid desaturase
MADYPFTPIEVKWKRPAIDHEILKRCVKRSNFKGLVHSIGVLAVLGLSGTVTYLLFAAERWVLVAIALYVHGALFAFNPQTHEFSHRTVFRSRWLNELFSRIFGIVHWGSNMARYRMSHTYHHRYTLHSRSEGERVHPRAELTEDILQEALRVVNVSGFLNTIYDQVYSLFRPYLKNPRRSVWARYVYEQAKPAERRDAEITQFYQVAFHILFAVFAILTGRWFLIVVVSLPAFYGGTWYHKLVHDTMHVGREPEANDFRRSCRTIRVDPFTSFMYWHMEWHTEHHTYASVPCYNLRKFHKLTREHWDPPQTIAQAWREMNQESRKFLAMQGQTRQA